MKTRISKIIWLVALFVVGCVSMANAQAIETDDDREQLAAASESEEHFKRWDANSDDLLNKNEFRLAMEDKFGEWDSNHNGAISRGEWKKNISLNYGFREYEGAYGEWDTDGSRGLEKEEFLSGLMSIFDENGDGNVDNKEYNFWTREPDSR